MTIAHGGVELAAGVLIPDFSRQTGFRHWNRYAAVNDEFVDIHMSDDAGNAAGYAGAIAMGNLLWAYLHNMLTEWIGERGHVQRLECEFRRPALRECEVRACGRIVELRKIGDSVEVDLEVWVEDGDGAKLVPGLASVVIPAVSTQRT